MDVSVIVISYNTRDLTLACLRSVYAHTRGVSFEVIVFDNASADGSADAIAAAFPQARLCRSAENVGFAGGNNLAAEAARGTYLLLLNPDTEIHDGAVQTTFRFAERQPGERVVGGRTFFADGTLNHESCHGRPSPWSMFCLGLGLASAFRRSRLLNPEALGGWPRDSVRRVDAVSGCYLFIRQDLWVRLNGFDKSFFMYGEDTDLCLRAAGAGAACVICPDATLIHHGGRSEAVRADKIVRLFRAKRQIFEKHWPRASVPFGVRMLMLWAWSRASVLGLLHEWRPSRGTSWRCWREVWHRRAEFALPTPREA